MKIKEAQVIQPIFVGGKSFTAKLSVERTSGLRMEYDQSEKELRLYYNNEQAIIPSSAVVSMTIDDGMSRPGTKPINPVPVKVKAQASTPVGIRND